MIVDFILRYYIAVRKAQLHRQRNIYRDMRPRHGLFWSRSGSAL